MALAMMNTHKAFKALQLAGIDDRQAEAMVDIFAEMQQDNALSRADLMQAADDIKHSMNEWDTRHSGENEKITNDIEELKTDVRQLKIDVAQLKIDVAQLKTEVAELKIDVAQLKIDVRQLQIDVAALKNDMRWIKRLLMVMTTTMMVAAIKYIFT